MGVPLTQSLPPPPPLYRQISPQAWAFSIAQKNWVEIGKGLPGAHLSEPDSGGGGGGKRLSFLAVPHSGLSDSDALCRQFQRKQREQLPQDVEVIHIKAKREKTRKVWGWESRTKA